MTAHHITVETKSTRARRPIIQRWSCACGVAGKGWEPSAAAHAAADAHVANAEPAVGTRWIHRRGGRVCVVDAVFSKAVVCRACEGDGTLSMEPGDPKMERVSDHSRRCDYCKGNIVTAKTVSYHYESTAGSPPGRLRGTRTPTQDLALTEWSGLFTVAAPPPGRRR